MQFVLHQLIPMSVIANLTGYEDVSEDLVNTILDEADKFASQVLSPLNWSGDQAGCVYQDGAVQTPDGFKQAYQQYSEAGWMSLAANADFGGQGLPLSLATAVNEMWHSANMAFMLCPMLTAGAIEAIASILAMKHSLVPPTINHTTVDENIDPSLNLTLNTPQKREIKVAMSNTFGFGGHNACVLFKKLEE
jgi:hypothetical protein